MPFYGAGPAGAGARRSGGRRAGNRAAIPLLCESAVLMEPESGQILFEQNAGERPARGQRDKVMAILLALEALEAGRATLGDPVTISKTAAGMGGLAGAARRGRNAALRDPAQEHDSWAAPTTRPSPSANTSMVRTSCLWTA